MQLTRAARTLERAVHVASVYDVFVDYAAEVSLYDICYAHTHTHIPTHTHTSVCWSIPLT